MIIPVGLNHVVRGWPRVTIALIVACTLVQIYASVWAPSADDVTALVDARVREHADTPDASWETSVAAEIDRLADRIPIIRLGYPTGTGLSWRLFTSAFVHDGWLHLIGNMLFLWLAGAALEDRWGRLRFAAFYLVGAAAATLCFDALHSGPDTILVGASGAISALMGAFLVFFARMRIHFAYWFWTSVGTFELAAYIALPIWLGEQLLSAYLQGGSGSVSGVAFTAHIGGFLFGCAFAAIAKLASRQAAEGAEAADVADALASGREPPPRAIARLAPNAAAKPQPPPPRPKLEAPAPPPPPRDPNDGPTFLG
jgi:membrane associated rhomboid family serine protease